MQFWPDHFFNDLMKFIVDICARAVTDGVPYVRAYYSRTTSKVLPTPLVRRYICNYHFFALLVLATATFMLVNREWGHVFHCGPRNKASRMEN